MILFTRLFSEGMSTCSDDTKSLVHLKKCPIARKGLPLIRAHLYSTSGKDPPL